MASSRASGGSSDYEVVKQLGTGAFGSVAKVVRRSDRKAYAMKTVQIGKMEEREVADALNECRILASIRHPRIVNFEAAFLNNNGRELCLVMELCERGDLAGRVKKCQKMRRRVDERTIWANMVEMAEGLVHLHGKNISHRDLKPANVFLAADGTAKLGDLNVSKLTKGDDLMQTKIGTPYYMAPEVWAGKKYDEACDVWSLGTVVYELAALEPPFQGQSLMQLRRAVAAGKYAPLPSSYSPQLGRILAQMLTVDPHRRIKALDILEHEEVRRRRASRELAHPAPAADDADDTELLATIKPPKSRHEVKALSDQLSAMSAQVVTARSGAPDTGRSNNSHNGSDYGGPGGGLGGAGGRGAAPMKQPMQALSEDAPNYSNLNGGGGMGLPPSRFGNNGNNGNNGYGGAGPSHAGPSVEVVAPPVVAAAAPPMRQQQQQPSPPPPSEDPLPPGWKQVPSQSRPGAFSYLNVNTGERVAERPSRPASQGGQLPPGWKKVPSQSRPGEFVYMNVNTGERIAWRPAAVDGSRPGQQAPRQAANAYR